MHRESAGVDIRLSNGIEGIDTPTMRHYGPVVQGENVCFASRMSAVRFRPGPPSFGCIRSHIPRWERQSGPDIWRKDIRLATALHKCGEETNVCPRLPENRIMDT